MSATPLFHKVDAVTIPVPDLDTGLRFYRDSLGHELRWRNDAIGQAGLALAAGDTEIVLTTRHGYEPNWLVASADEAAAAVQAAGGRVVTEPFDIPVGRAGRGGGSVRQHSRPARLVQGTLRHRHHGKCDCGNALGPGFLPTWNRPLDSRKALAKSRLFLGTLALALLCAVG